MTKYIVIGGNPFTPYTGTTTFTGLKELGQTWSEGEANELALKHFDDCGGLIQIFPIKGVFKFGQPQA